MLSIISNIRNYGIKNNNSNVKCRLLVFTTFSTSSQSNNNITASNTKAKNNTKKYDKKAIKSNDNKNGNGNVNNDGNGVPYRRLAFSSSCYYSNNSNTIVNRKHSNDECIKAFTSLFKNSDINVDSMTPIEMVEKCLAVNEPNSLLHVLINKLPDGYSFDDRISRRILRLLSSKGNNVFMSLLEILRGNLLTVTANDVNSIITGKIKDKKMADAFSILTMAEDKGLIINEATYIAMATYLLDDKVGFDSNAFFYIISEMKDRNIRIPIMLKEKMLVFCKMFPSLRWQHARKFITDFYKDYDLPITRTESRLVKEALETMILSYRVEEALETWVDLSLFKKDKNHETNYEIFTHLNDVELAAVLGRAAIILKEREILSFLLKSKALALGHDENTKNVSDTDENFDQYVEELLLSERMLSSSGSSQSATVVAGLGLGWLISRNKIDVASRVWNNDNIMQVDKRLGALQLLLDTFVYWKNEQGIPPSITIDDIKKISLFTADIIRGDTLSDVKLSKEMIETLISLFFLVGEKDGAVAAIMRSLEQSIEVSDASFIKVCQMLNNIEEHEAVIEIYKARWSSELQSKVNITNSSIVAARIYSPLMIAMSSLGLIDDMMQLLDSMKKKGMQPTFPLYIIMMEGFKSIDKPDEAVKFIANQPKPKDLLKIQVTSNEKLPENNSAILTSALHSLSLSSSASSDDIIAILQKYCVSKLGTLQIQLILTYLRTSILPATDSKKVLQYITMSKLLPSYLTVNSLTDIMLLSMVSKDESLLRSVLDLMNESEHTFSIAHTVKHKALGNIIIDMDTLEFIGTFDKDNHKIISKTLKIGDINDLNKLL